MVACLARTGAGHGAAVATNVRVDGLVPEGSRVTGVTARDLAEGADLTIRARHVVLATGAWTSGRWTHAGGRDEQDGPDGRGNLRVRPSKGVHIVVPRGRIQMDTGLLARTEKSGLFAIPWGDHCVIGATDTPRPRDPP